jgi:hypothetical protein
MIEDILAAKKSIVIRVVRRGMVTDYCLSLTLKWLWREGGNIPYIRRKMQNSRIEPWKMEKRKRKE